MNWDSNYTIALIPPGAAIVVSLLVVMFGGSTDAGQWAAIITFFVTLPFVVSGLFDRAK
jgi:uncharacterized protein YybS (DUF2232 family)